MGSVRSFKKLKGKCLVKRTEVKFDYNGEEFALPLRSLGVLESAEPLNLGVKPPKVTRKATKEEQDEYLKENPDENKALLRSLKITEYDYTDEEYINKVREFDNIKNLLDLVRFVDLEFKIGKEKLWENLGLKDESDLTGLIDLLFNQWKLDNAFLQRFSLAIKSLSNDPLWTELQKLDGAFGDKSWFELLPILTKALESENENSAKS